MVKGVRDGSFDVDKYKDLKDISNADPFQEILRKIKRDLDKDDDNSKESS